MSIAVVYIFLKCCRANHNGRLANRKNAPLLGDFIGGPWKKEVETTAPLLGGWTPQSLVFCQRSRNRISQPPSQLQDGGISSPGWGWLGLALQTP